MQTLWEKEVLLLRGRIALPKLNEGHLYRLVLGGQGCMNNGDGFRVYVNGKLMFHRNRGWGKRESGPMAFRIDNDWWSEFEGGEIDVAVISFLRIHKRSNVKGNMLSVFVQEMKVPPLGEKEILNSVKAFPMLSSQWQALQDPEAEDKDPEAGKFRWNGKFEQNKAIGGSWVQLGQVKSIEEFKPADRIRSNKHWPLQQLELKSGGKTDERLLTWSGDILMDLNRNQALKMSAKTIDGAEYLFVEAGGFNTKGGPEWKSPLYVMKRK